MAGPDTLRYAKIRLTHGSGAIPVVGFDTLIPDPRATKQATKAALEVGFRHFDCAERWRNEQAVGDAMQEMFKARAIQPFAALGHGMEPRLVDDPVIIAIARRLRKTPAQVVLAWAVQRGTALLTTSVTPSRIRENFELSALPEDAMQEIRDGVATKIRFNTVVEAGVPGFIPRGR